MSVGTNKTILKNTFLLYIRTFILLILGLYTSRITMQALGVENYGVINVVGGFVSMFSLLSGALTGACQRFLTYELGKENGNVRQVFSTTFYIHVILAILVLILAETLGLYFVNNKLNFPQDKMVEVHWLFQCSVISFVLNLLNIPYNALIIAYERMRAFAYISLIEAVLKLCIVYVLLLIPYSPLISYAILTLISSTTIRIIYQIYCRSSFNNASRLERVKDSHNFVSIFKFASWSFIGNSAYVLNSQGINIILNIFGGVIVNAARGVATIVENTITGFINNFTTSLNPQITKNYAQANYLRFADLLNLGIRVSYILSIVMILPIIFSINKVLDYWLTVYAPETPDFVIVTLCAVVFQAMSNPLMNAVNATGTVRTYQLIVGGINLLNLPISYILLYKGYPPLAVFICNFLITVILFLIRLLFVKYLTKIDIRNCYCSVFYKILPSAILSGLLCYLLTMLIDITDIFSLVLRMTLSFLAVILCTLLMVTTKEEKKIILSYIRSKIYKI